jgi:hypothetical protein
MLYRQGLIAALLFSACSLSDGPKPVTSPTLPRTSTQPQRAECAWVLWFTTATSGGGDVASTPTGGYRTAKECLREAELARKTVLADHMKKYPRDMISATCLPDTIDPRRPK